MTAAAIASNALLKMLYSSLIAGIGIAVVFSIAILAAVRSSEMRRGRRTNAAVGYGALAAAALLLSAAIVAYGLYLVGHKT
jgi:uncharacterized protein (DUF2062 family)